jgi:HK97 family phage major capsid protein
METKEQLEQILAKITEQKAAGDAEIKKFGTMLGETVEKLTALQTQADALDVKLAERFAPAMTQKSGIDELKENEDLKRWCFDKPTKNLTIQLNAKQMHDMMERKTNIDTAAVGLSTSGVLPFDRTPGIVQEARQTLRLRNVLPSRPTSLSLIDYVKVNSAPSRASMQVESSAKVENAVTFNTGTARVQTIASLIPASRQILDDMPDLFGYLQNMLPYYVNLTEEVQMLTGSNTGQDLNGLVTQGTAYNTALNSNTPGWKQQDILARAIQQIMIAKEIDPTFVVLHPTDYWNILLTKDSQGRYLNSGPYADPRNAFFGLTPIVTTVIGSGTFLVGSGNPVAAEIRDRMDMTVEFSTQHSTFFASNQIMIRAEKRMTLVVYRPASFIQGSLNTSP